MQPKMESSKMEWTGAGGKSGIDRTVAEVKSFDPEQVRGAARELTTRVRAATSEIYGDAIDYAKKNPVRTALGLTAFGFFAGLVTSRFRRSS